MHFVFEKFNIEGQSENFISCPDVNSSGIRRFTPSPIASALFRYKQMSPTYKKFAEGLSFGDTPITNKKYVIATGVTHSPSDWCGPDYQKIGSCSNTSDRASLFHHIPKKYLADLRSGRAFLLIDQSHEGYQVDWLWSWFHNNCDHYEINPKQIIYVTGNLECKKQYDQWADYHKLKNRIFPIPYTHFENMIFETAINHKREQFSDLAVSFFLPTTNDHIAYKTENLDNIKVYNALQKRPRAHRAWLFKTLYDNKLLDCGINSMNMFELKNTVFEGKYMEAEEYNLIRELLPLIPVENPPNGNIKTFSSSDSGSYLTQFNENIMLNSWVTVISEASFGDNDNTCFISEKSFKPISCMHPFIIFGNRHSLEHLKEMGYRTFSPFIDESYDNLPSWDRLDAIIKEIEKIKNMSPAERLTWYKKMQPILEYNYEIFFRNNRSNIPEAVKILKNYIEG